SGNGSGASNSGATTNGPSSTMSSGTSTGGTPRDRCQLPIDSGQCNAYFAAYAYNSMSGLCEPFGYGGCGGNDNRFDSLDACLEACSPGGRTACQASSDCVIDHGCCGYCDISSVDELVAVNSGYAGFRAPECTQLGCVECETPPE